jgi:hypothetical protein
MSVPSISTRSFRKLRQIDRDLDRTPLAKEQVPVVDCALDHDLRDGVVTLSEIGLIWTINQQAKFLKLLSSTLAVVGKFRSV